MTMAITIGLRIMLKIMKPTKKSISGTFILLSYSAWTSSSVGNKSHFLSLVWSWGIKVGVHFSCFMTILSHFGFIIFSMTRYHGTGILSNYNAYLVIIMIIFLLFSTARTMLAIIVTPPGKSRSCRIRLNPNSSSRNGVIVFSTIINLFIISLSRWL